jgi:hypothetical protein
MNLVTNINKMENIIDLSGYQGTFNGRQISEYL